MLVGVLLHKQIRHHKISQTRNNPETYIMSEIKAEFSKTVLKILEFQTIPRLAPLAYKKPGFSYGEVILGDLFMLNRTN